MKNLFTVLVTMLGSLFSYSQCESGAVAMTSDGPICKGHLIYLVAATDNVSPSTNYSWSYLGEYVTTTSENNVNVNSAQYGESGNWTVTVDNNPTCGGTISTSHYVEVIPIPNPEILLPDDTICRPNSKTLNVRDNAMIEGVTTQWYRDNTLISGANDLEYLVTETGEYSVVMSNQGCTSEATPQSEVNILVQDIRVSAVYDDSSLEGEGYITLSANVTGSLDDADLIYEWQSIPDGPISNSESFDYYVNGSDSLYLTVIQNSSGCAATSQKITITSDGVVSSLSNSNILDVKVFPTVSNGSIQIEASTVFAIAVYDSEGRLILRDDFAPSRVIDIEAKSGVYFVHTKTATNTQVHKVIIR